MKDRELFDILNDAENDSMDRLSEKCPELTDKQLEKILAMSERKFNMRKNETDNSNTKIKDEDSVEGVERSRRPAWFAPLCTAASLILVIGIIAGSAVFLNRNNRGGQDHVISDPSAEVTTTTVPGTDASAVGSTATVTEARTTVSSTETAATQTDIPQTTETADENFAIDEFVGTWTYQVSDGKYNVELKAEFNGLTEIYEDSTFVYTDADGNVTTGEVKLGTEEIGGTLHNTISFYSGTEFTFGGYYDQENPDEIALGNGEMARLVRGVVGLPTLKHDDMSQFAGEWQYQIAFGDKTVQEAPQDNGTILIAQDSSYTYSEPDGTISTGFVRKGEDGFVDGHSVPTVEFYNGDSLVFSGWYEETDMNVLYIGRGGLAQIVRIS